jgi:Domain of unknown function (DUF929)
VSESVTAGDETGGRASPPSGPEPAPADDLSRPQPVGERDTQRQPQPLSRTARFAWGAVIVILIGVVTLVIYAFTMPSTRSVITPTPTPPSVVDALAHVSPSTFDAVGTQVTAKPTPLTAPTILAGQPRLALDGKPEVLFVGADYCPFCATERWPLIVALSRFGHFSGLHDTQSAGSSVFSDIQTFTFQNVGFTSPYLSFVAVELYSDELNPNGTYVRTATLTAQQAALVNRYGAAPRRSSTPIPFLDIANRMVATTAAFSPGLLTRQSQSDLVAALEMPHHAAGQAMVIAANQLTVGLCMATGQRPASVCASKGVRAEAAALGVS